VMEPFPESATFGWVISLGIGAVLVARVVIGLILRSWPRARARARHE
jgi:hypothetical protein